VTDPGHPLYGRTFELVSQSGSRQQGHLWVQYRDGIVLRLPRRATNLALFGQDTPRATLSRPAVEEFLSLVKEYESCAAKSPHVKSGMRSRPRINNKSSRN